MEGGGGMTKREDKKILLNDRKAEALSLMQALHPDGMMICPACNGYGGTITVELKTMCAEFKCPCGFAKIENKGDHYAKQQQRSQRIACHEAAHRNRQDGKSES